MADESKNFLALLNGLARRSYYNEGEYTDEVLHDQIYPDMPAEEFSSLIQKSSTTLKNMVSADMDFNQLEAFLTSQMKRRDHPMTEVHANVYRKFWKTHKNKIHDILVSQSNWNNSLKKVSWRIDIKSQSRHVDQMNEPTAIVELTMGKSAKESIDGTETVQFEMDESSLGTVLKNLKDIEDNISKYCEQ
ncbi:hypothetical protein FSP39_011050 [Pinctada imbricata]|uniref:COMM domain-containing protein 1 n=1 Tax=Pinctada imbricata TaxID=66713 RepID=A0AA89BSX6_PINIB|nr:hypothetical protein FSP39_011050 [Pinctada imbricata]